MNLKFNAVANFILGDTTLEELKEVGTHRTKNEEYFKQSNERRLDLGGLS